MPPSLRDGFRDLDYLLRELAGSASFRLVIVSPYLSAAGLVSLRSPLSASAQRGAWIRIITSEVEGLDSANRRALHALVAEEEGAAIRRRLRILTARAPDLLLHAKILIADGRSGYLGSANLSWSALERNFEVGAALTPVQAKALDDMMACFESQGLVVDRTPHVFGVV